MKRILTTAAIVTALALPAFAEGDDPSSRAGEPKSGSAKASTDPKQDAAPAGSRSMGQGVVVAPRATTGAATAATDENRNPAKPGEKTGVSSGGDGSSGGSGASGGSGGSGGGSQ